MNNNFSNIVNNAILKCDGYSVDEKRKGFSNLYPFTTENISAYISKFDLDNKSLLTVGSSGDQVINASIFNCKDQTVLDICPYTKFYFYLKKAALLTLNYKEFMNFFSHSTSMIMEESNIFNKNTYEKLKPTLRLLDYESYLFWDELFSTFEPIQIRKHLFFYDEDKIKTLKQINPYLKDEEMYKKAQKNIVNVNPTFIIEDIFSVELTNKYDNIFLSNICAYSSRTKLKELVDKLDLHLNDNGMMLFAYLYQTTKNTKYKKEWCSIYDLKKTLELFKDYVSSFDTFIGVKGIMFNEDETKDSVLIYKK